MHKALITVTVFSFIYTLITKTTKKIIINESKMSKYPKDPLPKKNALCVLNLVFLRKENFMFQTGHFPMLRANGNPV